MHSQSSVRESEQPQSYWAFRLAGELPESVPVRDFARPAPYRHETASAQVLINDSQQQALCRLGRTSPDSLLAFLIACIDILLARHTGHTDVVVAVRWLGAWSPGLPIRSQWTRETPLCDFLPRLEADLARDFAQANSFAKEGGSRPPCPVSVSLAFAGADVAGSSEAQTNSDAEITFDFRVDLETFEARAEYNALIYRSDSMSVIARQLGHVIASALDNPGQSLGSISLHDAQERRRILYGFNDNRCAFPHDQTLSGLIEQQVRRSPGQICAIHNDRHLTFAALNATANQVGALLRQLGVGPGRFVAILEPRGLHFVTAMLAIWKAGGAYIPVEPSYPEDRVRYMLSNSEVPVVIVGRTGLARIGELARDCPQLSGVVCLNEPGHLPTPQEACRTYGPEHFRQFPETDGFPAASPRDPAYMVYTSGSTGLPKGAIVRHDGAVNHIFAQAHCLGAEGVKNFLQSAPSSSDISVWQFAGPLVLGGKTVIIDDASDVENLAEQVRRHRLSIIEVVPVVLKYLIDYLSGQPAAQRALPDLRWAMATGESVSVELVNAWLDLYPSIPVVNAYGPTEAADDIAQAIIDKPLPANQLTVPIGHPLANLDIYILDDELEPLPIGAPGEICVAGIGVGNGYWKQEEKNRASFCVNPFPESQGKTIYRTGDIGRLRDDGTIECFGRKDDQIKLHGFRIELGEIEAVLRGHPQIKDAVVLAVQAGAARGQLAAFVVARTVTPIDSTDLRAFVAGSLPAHMVPAFVVGLRSIPQTPAGKVDRQALGAMPMRHDRGVVPCEAAGTEAQMMLARIWREEFDLDQVGIDENFFDLGGDSLTAVAIVAGARNAGLRIRPSDVFDHPTVAGLASVARRVVNSDGKVANGPARQGADTVLSEMQRAELLKKDLRLEDAYALSPTQQGIYLHALLSRDKSVYIDQYCFVLRGSLNRDTFRSSWETVLQRHPALRSTVSRRHARRPIQIVHRDAELPFEFIDVSNLDVAEQDRQLTSCREAEVRRGFDMDCAPLMRLTLVRLAAQTHYLIWTHHHLIMDGWSMTLVLREVIALAECAGGTSERAVHAAPTHRRYVEWLQALDAAPDERFWRQTLAGYRQALPLGLPATRSPRPSYATHDLSLPLALTCALAELARVNGVTLGTVLHAGWAILLSGLAGHEDVVFGMVSSGREIDLDEVDAIVGLLITTLPLRLDAAATGALGPWLLRVQGLAADTRTHDAMALAEIHKCSEVAADHPLFETLFVMSNYPQLDSQGDRGIVMEPAEFRTVPAFPITLVAVPGPNLLLRLIHDEQRFEPGVAKGVLEDYGQILSRLSAGEDPRRNMPTWCGHWDVLSAAADRITSDVLAF